MSRPDLINWIARAIIMVVLALFVWRAFYLARRV